MKFPRMKRRPYRWFVKTPDGEMKWFDTRREAAALFDAAWDAVNPQYNDLFGNAELPPRVNLY